MPMENYRTKCALTLALVAMLAGCNAGTKPQPLYQWGSYQDQVYGYFKGSGQEKQIAALEQDLEKMRGKGQVAPPGFHAQLGLLYAETGDDGKAAENFLAEKSQYPESAHYMDLLLNKYKGKAGSQ
ncbi:DUF4810 domain-containing protein [Dyella mobilis]|uniref:DUF4810 domain-containing protein n=3 Tax=Dyella mobilis TaxID=1849582 RepID=A0ABS2KDV7_9GAMM|nr:DUF4810 domain-containing protein [Dyella mobilis]MBM7129352.1 DUF4810 domain-containing protein [Dyella mobilis]